MSSKYRNALRVFEQFWHRYCTAFEKEDAASSQLKKGDFYLE